MSRWPELHPWDVSVKEAATIQTALARRVVIQGGPADLGYVAGLDIGLLGSPYLPTVQLMGALVVMEAVTGRVVETVIDTMDRQFPYVPGLLAFREGPLLLRLLEQAQTPIDLVFCDGQGVAHKRRFGVACTVGLWTGIPTIGLGKSVLYGVPWGVLAEEAGAAVPLVDPVTSERVGTLLRTRDGKLPMVVSPGHLVGHDEAVALTMMFTGKTRVPEPTRLAHEAAAQAKRQRLGRPVGAPT